MLIGAIVRNMGEQSTPDTMGACARAAEAAGLESVWVVDHIAIPPGRRGGLRRALRGPAHLARVAGRRDEHDSARRRGS